MTGLCPLGKWLPSWEAVRTFPGCYVPALSLHPSLSPSPPGWVSISQPLPQSLAQLVTGPKSHSDSCQVRLPWLQEMSAKFTDQPECCLVSLFQTHGHYYFKNRTTHCLRKHLFSPQIFLNAVLWGGFCYVVEIEKRDTYLPSRSLELCEEVRPCTDNPPCRAPGGYLAQPRGCPGEGS